MNYSVHTGELRMCCLASFSPEKKAREKSKSHFSSGENVTRQHQVVVCRMNLVIKKRKQVKAVKD